MPEEWSRVSDLHLELPAGLRPRAALERALRDALSQGRLAPGSLLPSSRALADQLGLARGTVVEAYAQLSAEGYLVTRPRAGTRVAAYLGRTAASRRPAVTRPPHVPVAAKVDFRPIGSDVSSFPRSAWQTAMRHAIRTTPDSALGYGHLGGYPALRDALAAYLGRVRGVRTTAEQIVVCAGYSHGLSLVAQALRARGATRVAVEEPGFLRGRAIVEHAGLTTDPVIVDGEGIRVDLLDPVDAALVIPAHHVPLGVTMSPGRRSDLIAWAHAEKALIIEDDYDGEFRYDRQPVGAVQGLAPERAVYIGTTSKSLAPAVRLGWLVLPEYLVDPILRLRELGDVHSPTLDQAALAHLIETGALDRHLRRMRMSYRRRRDQLLAALAARLPEIEVTGIAAGYHAALLLPADVDEARIVAGLAGSGVQVFGLAEYTRDRPARPGLVVGYGTPPGHAFATGLDTLIGRLTELLRSG